ncbi:MAG TPA: glutaredoxin 3 [Candidatus Binatia bacterium]|jgi:glutaredoxin 3
MAKVTIYTTGYCPYCIGAKALLRAKRVEFEEIDVTEDPARRSEMERLSRRRTVPQIFIDGIAIGGFDDARALDAAGELDRLLGNSVTSG